MRRRVANCFVVSAPASGLIAGYYTIASAGIPFLDLPPEESRRLPRYPSLPAVRIGRLAVDRRFQGRGFGEILLLDAMRRSMNLPPAVHTPAGGRRERPRCGILSMLRFSFLCQPAANPVPPHGHGREGLLA